MTDLVLRDMTDADFPVFFEQQLDADARHMAAFTSKDPTDRAAFQAHWARNLGNASNLNKTIVVDGQVAGHVSSFVMDGQREVTYWLGRSYWGRGLATRALSVFLTHEKTRPLHARAAKDNLGSRRVLEKCGFVVIGEDKGFANARGAETEEFLLILRS
ncbi:GNAT family N-acetyltransferase [Pyxidicoccus parkwayensis]|uniref:GNAT family N-acetyltransferase n=1 Tax=Pyxidicoccus parkwayensis TaxID=2813578 RepID=UPI001F506B35|nr:GNAT family N-acetyltransferase [Pyxidicoccus parkwaysis]